MCDKQCTFKGSTTSVYLKKILTGTSLKMCSYNLVNILLLLLLLTALLLCFDLCRLVTKRMETETKLSWPTFHHIC